MKYCIINGKIVLENEVVKKNLVIEDDKIIAISKEVLDDATIVDAQGMYVSPGFIDVHVHGKNGSDTMNDTFEDINNISVSSLKTGVTGFLPTTMTQSVDATYRAIKNVRDHIDQVEGSKILGIHMEGPFFNESHKGAQPGEFLQLPSIENYQELVKDCGDKVVLLSLAPELEGSHELTSYLVDKGIIVSIGHTAATYEQAKAVVDLGANHATHTYNAMTPLTHRAPGVVGLAMDCQDVYAELILDGHHVSLPAARILYQTKKEHLVLVTDSMEACMKKEGKYQLGGQDVFVKDHQARLIDGTLAGSVLCMNHAVKNAMDFLGVDIVEAVKLASLNPANSINMGQTIGSIAVGKKADIVIFDENVDIKHAFVDGQMKF